MAGLGLLSKKVEEITAEDLLRVFPDKKSTINEKTLSLINGAAADPEFNGHKLLDTMANYQNVMYKNSASIEQYLDALKFCAYLETNESIVEAYKRTFGHRKFVQDRHRLDPESVGYRELTSAASRYRKSPMVIDILTQADVPLYLMFQGFRYEAVMTLAREMSDAQYSKDRINAADKLLTHVKPPDNIKIEMDVGIKKDSVIDEYEMAMRKMVEQQRELIAQGADIKAVANAKIKVKEDGEDN